MAYLGIPDEYDVRGAMDNGHFLQWPEDCGFQSMRGILN